MNKVAEYMTSTIHSASPEDYVHEAIDKMYQHGISSLLVENEQGYVGIITKTDWMYLVLRGECDPKSVPVSSLMTEILHTIDVEQTIADACSVFEQKNIRHLPVTQGNEITGILSARDMERYFLDLHKKTDF